MKPSRLEYEINRVMTIEEARRYLDTPVTAAERAASDLIPRVGEPPGPAPAHPETRCRR